MSNFGFGFHGSSDDNDGNDDGADRNNSNGRNGGGNGGNGRDNGGNDDPFGFGANPFGFLFGGQGGQGGPGQQGPGIGDILGQFGAMLSGFGRDMNSPDAQGPVNYALAGRIARQQITGPAARNPSVHDSQAVAESVRLVELWLDEATVLPAGATGSTAFSAEKWLEETMPRWRRIIDPLASQLGDATLSGLPEEARAQLGPMAGMLSQINGMNFGMQLGHALGELAKEVSMSTQWGIPLAEGTVAAVATGRLDDLSKKLGAERRETLIYLAAREAAHLRLFRHVPWLVERLILDVEEFATGLSLDNSALEEATREFNPEMMGDPAKMQEMMERLQNQDLAPKIVSSTDHARIRLETSLSLVEGWVDVVVGDALGTRLPATAGIQAAWSVFRDTTQPGMAMLSRTVGINLAAPKATQAADLWSRLTFAVGKERRDQVWNHPDFLPVDSDLDAPAEFIDSILAENEGRDFDPISEIEKLERERGKDDSDGDKGDGR
ncbi:zinc-dependent metalloprotease [Corynebacterium provencense]|jgi:putative hydrolase|uniref:zinc-dependent metalloprotease n=1 Tax=Corynebacterium provencense TaxID=1737425 RepID=UPI0008343B1B|nr:zinc-dependent metalloprotease [Corynebacterium provencense]MCI1256345.1 zinc-dependent metalloprotease [Corynebacterium provencense]